MTSSLIRTEGQFPPGSFIFNDRITGKNYKDTHTLFDGRVKEIIRDRLANRRLFTDERLVDFLHVSQELSEYTCARLRGNSDWCTDGLPNQPNSALAPKFQMMVDRKCVNCGSDDLKKIMCPTCSKEKITGWVCNQCNTKMTL